ncbi:MAG TPA: hypothetical protein VF158_11840 [Longimicrobiales bacterium]
MIGPGGGEVLAVAADGTAYRLAFPAGAVDGEVTVTLDPLATTGDEVAAVAVGPASLQLRVPATLEVTLPSGAAPASASFYLGAADAPAFLATTVGGATLGTELRFFTLPAEAHLGGVAEDASARSAFPALRPAQSTSGGQVVATIADCAQKLASLQHGYDLFVASESFESAVRVALNGADLASTCGDFEGLEQFRDLVAPAACGRYDEIVVNAQVVAADTHDVFTELMKPLFAWAATLDTLGVECPSSASWRSVLAAKEGQFITFYANSLEDLPTEEAALIEELRKIETLKGEASLLGLPEAEQRLVDEVQHPLVEMHRDAAYDECRETTDHYFLYSLFEEVISERRVPITPILPAGMAFLPADHAPFQDADLVEDIQHCASYFTVEVWSDPEVPVELEDRRVELTPAGSPGQQEKSAETSGPVEGHLVLRGPVEQMRCGQGRELVAHELVVLVEGKEVHRSATLDAVPEVEIASTLEDRGLPTDRVNTLDVVLRRESDACGGLYGEDYRLFEVSYTADPAPVANAASSSPGAIAAEEEVDVTFSVDWFDDGENLRQARIEYRLGESEATAQVDLLASEDASGFTGKEGVGTIVATHYVYCSEAGANPLEATVYLIDEYGQESEGATAEVTVSYAGCDGTAAPPRDAAVVLGAAR